MNAADANRLLYARIAASYDATEECVTDERLRAKLSAALRRARAELPRDAPLEALDACGGSGNASLLLFEMGIHPVTVDISAEMLSIFEQKASSRGYQPECVTAEIMEFLEADLRRWDLIVFSSALHHLDDVNAVVEKALDHMRAGGILVTMFDPTRVTRMGQRLRRIDYVLHVVLRTPGRVPGLLRSRLRPSDSTGGELRDVGIAAERHALIGIDDLALTRRLKALGHDVIEHGRYFEGRFALTRWMFRALRIPSAFVLIVRARESVRDPSSVT
jgi:SAM-dependent methyltransferase